MTSSQTDDELVGRIRMKDVSAFEEIYERTAGKLLGVATQILGEKSEAEEVVQDVLLQLWTKAASFDSNRASLKGWLYLMTRSRAIDRMRSRKIRMDAHIEGAEINMASMNEPIENVHLGEEKQLAHRALSCLAHDQSQLLQLAYFDGLTQNQIAAKLGLPLGTVKSRVRLAMNHMRKFLKAGSEND